MTCEISEAESQMQQSHFKTFDKLHSYTIVSSSVALGQQYYQWLKSTNRILGATLNKAEDTLETIRVKTEPYTTTKLRYVDEVSLHGLERLESAWTGVSGAARLPMQLAEAAVDMAVPVLLLNKTESVLDWCGLLATETGQEAELAGRSGSTTRARVLGARTGRTVARVAASEWQQLLSMTRDRLDRLRKLVAVARCDTEASSSSETSGSGVAQSGLLPLRWAVEQACTASVRLGELLQLMLVPVQGPACSALQLLAASCDQARAALSSTCSDSSSSKQDAPLPVLVRLTSDLLDTVHLLLEHAASRIQGQKSQNGANDEKSESSSTDEEPKEI